MLPNFICPGAQKAATTSLFHILKRHPEVYLPDCKEVHFFDIEENEAKGIEWYEEQFSQATSAHRIIGEMTPAYMYLDFIPGRLRQVLGEKVKFVFMLRNPIDRTISHYGMNVQNHVEKEPLERALALEAQRITGGRLQRKRYSYADRGFYAKQIKRFLEYFPLDNMCFVLFENFVENTPRAVDEILGFLGIAADIKIARRIWHNRTRRRKRLSIPPPVREMLREMFTPDIRELERLIDTDLSCWLGKAHGNK